MRSMCVGVAETGVNSFLFLSFSYFSDKRKELYKKKYLYASHGRPDVAQSTALWVIQKRNTPHFFILFPRSIKLSAAWRI